MTPDEHTIQETFLEVGDGHALYIQDWGNPKAKTPILFLHGGPGVGCSDGHKQLFDPEQQRVIFFDQRGSGKSLPAGSLEHNTTQDLVEDIEKIANHLELKSFVVTGGSWGSCLALAYALKYPKRVTAMVLRGVFTGAQAEIDWFEKGGFKDTFPDVWAKYLERTPKTHHDNPSQYHFNKIAHGTKEEVKRSAYAYEAMEYALVSLDDRHSEPKFEIFEPGAITVEMSYLAAKCFMPDNYILDNAHKLTMPIWLVQGRYDMICPPIGAYNLHQKLSNSQLIWTVAGHSSHDRATYDVLRTTLLQLAGGM